MQTEAHENSQKLEKKKTIGTHVLSVSNAETETETGSKLEITLIRLFPDGTHWMNP